MPETPRVSKRSTGCILAALVALVGAGAKLMADCAWPVEARFLAGCVDDHGTGAYRQGPYPFLDVPPRVAALTLDSHYAVIRKNDEQPAYHPLTDARLCAQLWRDYSLRIATGNGGLNSPSSFVHRLAKSHFL